MLESLGQWVQDVMGFLGYVGLALLLVLENLFSPIPSEVVLPLAGFFVGTGDFTFWGALLASTLGATAGALVLYALGRWGGRALVLRVHEEDFDRAEGWFARHGVLVVRFPIRLRSPSSRWKKRASCSGSGSPAYRP